jgi:DNA transformation protein and related proteins
MKGNFCLKVGNNNRKDFEDRGMRPYVNDSMKKGMLYWEVPAELLEDKSLLKIWTDKAFQEAIKGKK